MGTPRRAAFARPRAARRTPRNGRAVRRPRRAHMAFESIEHPQRRAFLSAYAACGNITRAAKAAGVSREAHYDWRAANAEYREAFEAAKLMAGERLEDDAH